MVFTLNVFNIEREHHSLQNSLFISNVLLTNGGHTWVILNYFL